jgi:blue copper oxidase
MLTRRTLLASCAGFGATALGGRTLLGVAESAEPQPLRIPKLIDARRQGQSIALTAQRGRTAFLPGRPTPTLGYNGTYLGPTLRLHRGDDVEVAVTNALAEDTAVHWHGLLVPSHLGPDRNGPWP